MPIPLQISFRNMDPSPAVEAIVREKAARAGTGFDRESLKSLHALLVPLITKMKPVAEKVPDEVNTTWVKPKLVGEVKFTEWTSKGEVRHPVFLGLRTDKMATDVIRKVPKPGAGTGH
jgi:bifunctional non-homologous end joining protein LigD